jgi:hypothetical protein
MVNMSDFNYQPITREALAAQAAAIAARQAQENGTQAVPLEVAPPIVSPPIMVPVVKTSPVVEESVVIQESVVIEQMEEPVAVVFTEVEKEIAKVDLDEDGNPQFKVSSTLTGEFTGSNLIVDLPLDITAGGALITDTGELVITGSIDVSSLITPTGEIDIISVADSSDSDLDRDAQQNFIPGIPPIRISGVIAKTQSQPGIPGGAHRGINPYWYVGMISVAALLIAGVVALSFYL